MTNPLYAIDDTSAIHSPGLIFFVDLIRRNLARTIEMAGSLDRLRPHVKTHKTPQLVRLARREPCSKDGDRIFVIASFAGSSHNPAWFCNLEANPVVTVEIGAERYQARARIANAEERERLFKLQADKMNIFYDYQKKTTRQIPVVIFERTN